LKWRDFIHIDNCIDACFAILEKVNDGTGVNIGTGALTSFNTLIREMLKLEGREATIQPLIDKPVGVNARYADITHLSTVIAWTPKLSLEEGLRLVLDGAKARLNGKDLPFILE
jgi:nucleoside-diphosphate-sugar epimerase